MKNLFILILFIASTSFSPTPDNTPGPKASITFQVTGTVRDENGVAMPGVSVLEKNTSNGTVTDADGKYSINVAGTPWTLIFSFIGYATLEMSGSLSSFSVTMNPDETELGARSATDKKVPVVVASSATNAKTDIISYPNPVIDLVQIKGKSGIKTYKLLNASGQETTTSRPATINGNLLRLNMAGLPKGIYILQVISADGTKQSTRLIKQ